MKRKLTLKQQRFADEYIISGNAEESARKAGYSPSYVKGNAYKLVGNVGISSYIDERLAELNEKSIAKQDEVLQYLTSVMRGETMAEVLIVEGAGDGVSYAKRVMKAPDERERLRAAEQLGKRYGLFTDKQDITLNVPVVFEGEDEIAD